MSVRRVPDAPKLIDWTGERCVPWTHDPQVIYEHYHRYLFAAELVRGRNVLDLASGEGYGAALLAETALSVIGVDIEDDSIEHSRRNYSAENLDFAVADARELSQFEPATFGAVVAFELIEHIAEHDQLLTSIERVLSPDGILVISSPNRTAYSEAREFHNPFHVRELTTEELLSLLDGRFNNVRAWGQKLLTGSLIWQPDGRASDADAVQRFIIESAGDDWRRAEGITAMYSLAVASNGELPESPRTSLLVDAGDELVHRVERAVASELAIGEELHAVGEALGNERQALANAREALANAHQAVASEREALANAHQALASEREALANERRVTAALEDRAAGDERTIAKLQSELANYQSMVESSVTWRLFQRARRVVYGLLGGRESAPSKLLQKALRGLGRLIR